MIALAIEYCFEKAGLAYSTLVCVDTLAQGSNRAHGYHDIVALLLMQDLQRIVRSGAEPFGIAITEAVEEGA